MADNFRFAQLQPYSLNGAGVIAGATSITLKSMTDIDGNALSMSGTFGTVGYGTLEPGNGNLEEQISFTGLTNNANGTVTLTGVSSVLFTYPYTQTSGLSKTHAGSTNFVISNTSGFYDQLTSKSDDETVTGIWTFTNPNYPRMDTDTPFPTDNEQLATKAYADSLTFSGAPDATTTQKGIVELATNAEVLAKTAIGGTGASLVATPDLQASTLLSDYKVDTGTSTAYAIAPAPAITAYTAGQRFTFKATNANSTTTPTLNVNGLGTKTIVKRGSVALAVSDIAANQIIEVEYDGTNMQLMSPVATQPATNAQLKFGGDGSDGALAISSGTTTVNLGGAAYYVKNYTSIAITGTGALAFSNPHANGSFVVLRSQGNVTLTSSATPMVNCSSMGAPAGTGGSGSDGAAGGTGTGGKWITGVTNNATAAGTGASGPGAVAPITYLSSRLVPLILGSGGAGGAAGANSGGTRGNGGAGGRGGGALFIECNGALNFTTASGISVAGATATNGTSAGGTGTGGGGGGGGGGGTAVILYTSLTAASGTITVSGGNGGAGGSGLVGVGGTAGTGGNGSAGSGDGGTQGTGGPTAGGGGVGSVTGTTGGTGGNPTASDGGNGGGGGGSGASLVASNSYFT